MNTDANFGGQTTHAGRRIRKSADRKQVYKTSFGDFPEQTVYRDPLGVKTPGPHGHNPVTFQKDWGETLHNDPIEWDHDIPGPNRASLVEKWNHLQRKGFRLDQTADMIGKSLGTGDFQLPLDIIQDVFIVNPEQTPAADFLPRVTTQDDIVHATPQTEEPDPTFDLQDNVATDEDGNAIYDFEDPTFEDLDYEVLGYGVATRTSDKLVLAGSNLRSHEAVQEEAMMLGHRHRTERQIFWGTDDSDPAEGDSLGWDGMSQMGEAASDNGIDPIVPDDLDTPDDVKETFEQLIDIVQENGAELGNIAIFCGYDVHRAVRRAFEDSERYRVAEELDVGFATFAMEGGLVPVFKTNAIPRVDNYPDAETNDVAFAVNLDSVALYQLQDVTLQPLARLGPESRAAVDQYNVLVSESGDGDTRDADHIQRLELDTS